MTAEPDKQDRVERREDKKKLRKHTTARNEEKY